METPPLSKPADQQGSAKAATRILPWTLFGLVVLLVAFGGAGGWSATVPIASAVIAQGRVTVDTNRKQIKHLEGGIVAELLVRDGDSVAANDVLIRLDETRAKASLGIVAAGYREELAKEARLRAERNRSQTIAWPDTLQSSAADPTVREILDGQRTIFESRRDTLRGETAVLRERIAQLEKQTGGFDAQRVSVEQQVALIKQEIEPLQGLFERGHTTKTRLLALQREAARLEGQHGELVAEIARTRNAVGETKLEIIQIEKSFRNEVVETLRDVQAKVSDLRERLVAARDVLQRLDIRAPVAGKVVGLAVHAEHAVIQPGETILEIVPSGDPLRVEVRIQPQDINNVEVGQTSEIRILAFRQRTTPTLHGAVRYVSADALSNPQDGSTFYLARIVVRDADLARLDGQELQPGMPAEVMIQTGERTALAYIMQPILESMNRAWREE